MRIRLESQLSHPAVADLMVMWDFCVFVVCNRNSKTFWPPPAHGFTCSSSRSTGTCSGQGSVTWADISPVPMIIPIQRVTQFHIHPHSWSPSPSLSHLPAVIQFFCTFVCHVSPFVLHSNSHSSNLCMKWQVNILPKWWPYENKGQTKCINSSRVGFK